jgi:secreted Zn-dependent insulinase-like peptidase
MKLDNDMMCLLISDKNTDLSACSLNVGVGSINNPEKSKGLAHFVEHLLFMGSKKYPDE